MISSSVNDNVASNMAVKFFKLILICFAAIVIVIVSLGILVLEDSAAVERSTAPTPEDVKEARHFVRGVRAAIQRGDSPQEPFEATEAQLNSVIKLGARFIPGFRGEVAIVGPRVEGKVSFPVPFTREPKWLNLLAVAPEFDDRFSLSILEIGGFRIPAGLSLEVARMGANVIFGNSIGDTVLASATAMSINDDVVSFDLEMDEMGQNGVMRGLFGALRGSDMPSSGEINRYYLLLREAMEHGKLPNKGSYLPYLLFALEAAHEGSRREGIANAYTSAMFALARICGAKDFTLIVGGLIGSEFTEDKEWTVDCSKLTLNGRIDSRRHFTTAAALQAASNRGFAVSVGEFKELYDTIKSGGFDFTDLAANNSGIRMSNTFMTAPSEAWPELLARIEDENDLIVAFEGIPQIMSGDDFRELYVDVESPEYFEMLEGIEAQIDGLALHK